MEHRRSRAPRQSLKSAGNAASDGAVRGPLDSNRGEKETDGSLLTKAQKRIASRDLRLAVQWIAWTSNVLLSSFHQAIRLSSSSTRCKVISTEKLLPCGGAHWAILNRSCTGPARGCNTCCGRISAIPSAISGRAWNQLWTRRPLLDRYAHNKKMNTAAAPTNLRISIFSTSPSRLVNPIS